MNNISEDDDWSLDGTKINSDDLLKKVMVLLDEGPIIVQRWFYRGSRAPERLILEEADQYRDLLEKLSPGDILEVWSFDSVSSKDNLFVEGKYPDKDGRVPRGGAY